jgi:hypothetical protein
VSVGPEVIHVGNNVHCLVTHWKCRVGCEAEERRQSVSSKRGKGPERSVRNQRICGFGEVRESWDGWNCVVFEGPESVGCGLSSEFLRVGEGSVNPVAKRGRPAWTLSQPVNSACAVVFEGLNESGERIGAEGMNGSASFLSLFRSRCGLVRVAQVLASPAGQCLTAIGRFALAKHGDCECKEEQRNSSGKKKFVAPAHGGSLTRKEGDERAD